MGLGGELGVLGGLMGRGRGRGGGGGGGVKKAAGVQEKK